MIEGSLPTGGCRLYAVGAVFSQEGLPKVL
jgi:hypothetical protein